ncbi:hypothetical protein GMSM_24260 [Geomonas sp. Red276]
MITRGLDGTFYEIPDDMADQYKVPPEEVQSKMGQCCGGMANAQMGGMGQEMMGGGGSPQGVVINVMNPSAVQNPMMGMPQGGQQQQQQGGQSFLQGAQEGAQAAGAQATCYSCYSCYCYNCYSCYCYHCYCYRTCYSCYVQPV